MVLPKQQPLQLDFGRSSPCYLSYKLLQKLCHSYRASIGAEPAISWTSLKSAKQWQRFPSLPHWHLSCSILKAQPWYHESSPNTSKNAHDDQHETCSDTQNLHGSCGDVNQTIPHQQPTKCLGLWKYNGAYDQGVVQHFDAGFVRKIQVQPW